MNIGALVTGLRFELRMMRRDRAILLALGALAALVGFSLSEGAGRVEAQRQTIDAARSDEAQRLSLLQKTLAELQKGDPNREPPPYRDPRNAAFMGAGLAAAVAALNPQPLAIAAIGQSDLYPPAIKVTTASKDAFLFADEIDNPANLMSGATDLAFVIVFVYPLFVLAFAFNLLAGEREQGSLALTLASARRPGAALAGKLFARLGAPIVTTLAAVLLGVAAFGGAGLLATPAFAGLLAVILLYGLFWGALAAAVDGLGRGSAFNALTLIGAWVVLTMIAPAAVNSLAGYAYPAPSRIDMTLAARSASTDADRERDAALARYNDEHGQEASGQDARAHDGGMKRGGARERTLRRLATQEAAFARVEGVIAEHDAQLARQRALADRLAFLSPALLTYRAIADIAGSGEARYHAFLGQIHAFHLRWRDFFLARARAGAPMTAADYAILPRFPEGAEARISPFEALAAPLGGVALPALVLAGLALRGFRRATPH
jgi:ABC-2 type transport system permease protein